MEIRNLQYVDALRGIAILLVVLIHTWQAVPNVSVIAANISMYGQMGVQLFFVASAYTMCISLERRLCEPRNVLSFYIRRFFRIAPLYYFAILIYFFFNILKQIMKTGSFQNVDPYTVPNVAANLLFLHGLIPQANNVIVPGGWSIGTEMLFYLIIPVGIIVIKKYSNNLSSFFALLLASALLNVLVQYLILHNIFGLCIENNSFPYYTLFNQIPVFIIGSGAYFFLYKHDSHIGLERLFYVFMFAVLTFFTHYLLTSKYLIAPIATPITAALSFFFLLAFIRGVKSIPLWLCNIGKVSYSIYVFHFLFAWYIVPFFMKRQAAFLNADAILTISFVAVCSFSYFVAILSQNYIERKGIELGKKIVSLVQK